MDPMKQNDIHEDEVITERDENGKPIAGRYSWRKTAAEKAEQERMERIMTVYGMRSKGMQIWEIAMAMNMAESTVRNLLEQVPDDYII